MNVAENIRELARDIPRRRKQVYSRKEDATKTSLVMPLIAALGYDIHDPDEVDPEFDADVGVKKGEEVDYAIRKDGQPIILVECKRARDSLTDKKHLSQLFRYYNATEARFGILTNGVEYRFYTDLSKPNVMDESPFLVVDMLELDDAAVTEVSRFAKSAFDAQAIWDLVHTREKQQKELQTITDNIAREFATPSKDLVRLLAKGVLRKGYQKPSEWERITDLTKRALDQHTGAVVVANSNSEISLSPAKTEEEKRKERQRKAGQKAADTRLRNQASRQSSEEPDFSKYQYWEQLKADTELYNLFMQLCEYGRSLGDDVLVNPTKYYISLWRMRTVAYIRARTGIKRLIVYVYADLKQTQLNEGFTRMLPDSINHPPCNVEIRISNQADLERAKPLIRRSYDETG